VPLGALGVSLGHLSDETLGLITLVGLITISASTYMILYSHYLYDRLAPYLVLFERRVPYRELDGIGDIQENIDVLLVGLGRYGAALAGNLRDRGCRLQVVDFDPAVVRSHEQEGFSVRYGDAEDPEFVASLPLKQAQWVVSTVRDPTINRLLLHGLKQSEYSGRIAVATSNLRHAQELKGEGVDIVLVPYSDAAKEASEELMAQLDTAGR